MGAADRNRDAADEPCRRRVRLAIAELAHERSLRTTTVAALCQRAEISPAQFERLYPSLGEAWRCAFAEAFDAIFTPTEEAAASGSDWLRGLAAGLEALLKAAAENPRLAELCLTHFPEAPAESEGNDYRAAVEATARLLAPARIQAEGDHQPRLEVPAMAEEFLAHGILFQAGRIPTPVDPNAVRARARELLMLVLMTFFGTDDAARMCDELAAG